jgi:hypothetical protein
MLANRAALACGLWNGLPGASSDETPQRQEEVNGAFRSIQLFSHLPTELLFSSAVVLIRVA